MSGALHGLLVLDKPAGISSAQALAPLKRRLPRRTRIGHAGTLDPFATGVLLALVGDATRLSREAMALRKRYVATVRFGLETDTLDPEGTVVREADPGTAAPDALEAALGRFEGDIEQVPPAYSALKVAGERAYRRARSGEEVHLRPRQVRIDRVAMLECRWPDVVVEMLCGTGTYVRAFARDLGAALGLPAHLVALRRTHVGPFAADDGADPAAADPSALRSPMVLVEAAGIPCVSVDTACARRFALGNDVPARGVPRDRDTVAVVTRGETEKLLVGLAEHREGGRLQPRTVFAAARARLEHGE